MGMAARIVRDTMKLCLFLIGLFGFLLALFIVADRGTSTLLGSFKYYIWMVLPLGGFGLIIGFVEILIKSFRNRRSESKTGHTA
jgi:TRAP-type C4-dicarboxylate transport system permease small subunit